MNSGATSRIAFRPGYFPSPCRTARSGKRAEHCLARGGELDAGTGSRKPSGPSCFLQLPDLLTDRAWRERELMRRLLHLSSARHGDESLQQGQTSDHEISLDQLNLLAKSIVCRPSASTDIRRYPGLRD